MNLLALPELRAAQNPEGPAVADDAVSLNNTEFLQAVRNASAALHRQPRKWQPTTRISWAAIS
jgi:hypothetical protein